MTAGEKDGPPALADTFLLSLNSTVTCRNGHTSSIEARRILPAIAIRNDADAEELPGLVSSLFNERASRWKPTPCSICGDAPCTRRVSQSVPGEFLCVELDVAPSVSGFSLPPFSVRESIRGMGYAGVGWRATPR